MKVLASTHGALPPDVRLKDRHLPLYLPLLSTAQAGLCINEIACDQQRSWLEPQQHSPCKCPARDTTQGSSKPASTTSDLQLSLQIVSSSSKHRSMTRVGKQSCNGFEQYSGKPDRVKPLSTGHNNFSRCCLVRNSITAIQSDERAKERAPEVSKLVPIQLLAVGQVIIAAQMQVRNLDEPCDAI